MSERRKGWGKEGREKIKGLTEKGCLVSRLKISLIETRWFYFFFFLSLLSLANLGQGEEICFVGRRSEKICE